MNINFNLIKLVVFDFDGVFTDNRVIIDQDGKESVICNRSDGLGLNRLRELGIRILILSTEKNNVVSKRALKLKVECIQGVENKESELINWVKKNKIDLSNTAFVGNDINDIPALQIVGFPILVADAFDEVLPFAKLKLSKNGGDGAVRELCDLIYFNYSSNNKL